MSWRCELTGKKALVGHKVSHSNIKTKRRFLPNLRNVTLISDTLKRKVRVRISANALKTVDHRGGLDAFLLKAKDGELGAKDARTQARNRQEARRRRGQLSRPPFRDAIIDANGSGSAKGCQCRRRYISRS